MQAGADLNAKNKYDETPAGIYVLKTTAKSVLSYYFLRFSLVDICEDPEIKERIVQLRTEQESKRQAAAQRKRVKKSSSNTRTQSVRRTSLRDKGLTQRRDAVEEARLRMQAEYKVIIKKYFSWNLQSNPQIWIIHRLLCVDDL